jgi:integrase/recombinase XerC
LADTTAAWRGDPPGGDHDTTGRVVIDRLVHGRRLDGVLLGRFGLLTAISELEPANVTVAEAVVLVTSHLEQTDGYRSQTIVHMSRDIGRMALHLRYHDVDTVAAISTADVEAWIETATSRRGTFIAPSVSTRHCRRSAARLFFQVLRQLHVTRVDPTLDIDLPARSVLSTRPLTDDEETVCRLVSGHKLVETRRPAAWALGQASATTTEQAAITVADLDLDNGRVWIHGCAKRTPRWGYLTDWGVEAVARAARRSGLDPTAGLVYGAQISNESGTASVCKAVHNILRDAGYSQQADVRPGSLPAWAGRRVFDETGSIETVALRLGLTSLDQAALVIGWDWRQG